MAPRLIDLEACACIWVSTAATPSRIPPPVIAAHDLCGPLPRHGENPCPSGLYDTSTGGGVVVVVVVVGAFQTSRRSYSYSTHLAGVIFSITLYWCVCGGMQLAPQRCGEGRGGESRTGGIFEIRIRCRTPAPCAVVPPTTVLALVATVLLYSRRGLLNRTRRRSPPSSLINTRLCSASGRIVRGGGRGGCGCARPSGHSCLGAAPVSRDGAAPPLGDATVSSPLWCRKECAGPA